VSPERASALTLSIRSAYASTVKVCFISHSAERGGAESSLLELVDALSRRGIRSSCVLPRRGALNELLADRGVETIVVPFKWWVHRGKSFLRRARRRLPSRQIPGIFRLIRTIRRSGCDVVYTNTTAVGAGAVAARIVGKPHIWHIREFGRDDHGLSYDLGPRFSRKLIGRLSSACIANSHAVADDYRPCLGETEVRVIYNSVPMPASSDEPPPHLPWLHQGAIRCALLGKWLPGKGQEDAVRAMVNLREAKVPAELLLLGGVLDRGYRRQVQRIVEQNELADRVHILGHSDDPMPLLKTADLVLMCSRREAFGRVTVEAMKLGKPVIGTRSGGTPEVVEERETGLLYTPGDTDGLAARIGQFYSNPGLRDAMGAKAGSRARERFNQHRYGGEVEEILRRVVSDSKRADESIR